MNENISVFRSVRDTKPLPSMGWREVLHQIRSDRYKKEIEAGHEILKKNGMDAYRQFKQKLPIATFCGEFQGKRSNDTIHEATGFIIPDLDHLKNVEDVFELLKQDRHIWFAFRSPSWQGIKCGIRAKGINTDEDIKKLYASVERYFDDLYGIKIDPACKDVARPTFVSYDPDLFIREDPLYFNIKKWARPSKQPPPAELPANYGKNGWKEKYGNRVLESSCNEIRSSRPGNQHYTRLKKARLVGGYVASGFIDEGVALAELEKAVSDSGAKNLKSAMKTVSDGLRYGKASPIYVESKFSDTPAPRSAECSAQKEVHTLSYTTLEAVHANPIEEKPIAKGAINEQDATILYSPGGVGKSLVSQDAAMFLGCPLVFNNPVMKPFLWEKFFVPKIRRSIFIQSENSRLATYQRTVLKAKGLPLLKDGLCNIFYPNIHDDVRVSGFFADGSFQDYVCDLVAKIEDDEGHKIDLMWVDPLISFHDAEENDNSRMRSTLDRISEVAAKTKTTPIVIHHANKENGIRGASSISDWARCVIKLESVMIDGDRCIRFTHEKSNNAGMFKPFTMGVDEHLNLYPVTEYAGVPKRVAERCGMVKQALMDLGGRVESQTALINQYIDLAMVTGPTAKRHIKEAIDNKFICREVNGGHDDSRKKYVFFVEVGDENQKKGSK